jgi:hypothetical protein
LLLFQVQAVASVDLAILSREMKTALYIVDLRGAVESTQGCCSSPGLLETTSMLMS